uniref:Small subunit processome component 20 homolog n=1 Tax=Glossina brevipalpis TaxID=37001 RepID=A0A1A9W7R9_9MUSC
MTDFKQKSKESNTFRFKSFADRVNEIDLRRLALYHIGHGNEELPEDNETYFHQTLRKWMDLNLTEEFSHFTRKVHKIVTLPQLLHRKDIVLDILLEHLATATNLSIQPLLELLYVLARDLREEFYPYFQRVLDRLICLLNTQDAEQLEWTFVCLAYLFKALKPYLKRNIGVVFNSILPLLDAQRYEDYVNNFAVECFSFIARDVRDYRKFLDFILLTLQREEAESVQACGRLLFEIMRGVKGQFHSIAGNFLEFIFQCLIDDQLKDPKTEDLLVDIVEQAMENLLKFIYPQHISLFWQKLCATADICKKAGKLKNLIRIFQQGAKYREGKLLAEMDVVVPSILRMLDKVNADDHAEDIALMLIFLISSILMSGSSLITQLDTSRLIKKCLTIKRRRIFEQFLLQMAQHVQFNIFLMPNLIQHFEEYFDLRAFELFAQIIMIREPLQLNALKTQTWKSWELKVNHAKTLQMIEEKLKYFEETKNITEERVLIICFICPHLKGLKRESLQGFLANINQQIVDVLKHEQNNLRYLNVLTLLMEVCYQLNIELSSELISDIQTILLCSLNYNLNALGALNQLLVGYKKCIRNTCEMKKKFSSLLSHHQQEIRTLAAHCLLALSESKGENLLYEIFYQAFCIEPNVQSYRQQLLFIQKLEIEGELFKSLSSDQCKENIVRFLLGLMHLNFKFLWDPIQKLLENYAKAMEPNTFWLIYMEKLKSTQEQIDGLREKEERLVISEEWKSETLNMLLTGALKDTSLTQQQLFNYRLLLWQRLPYFGKLVEVKNREIVLMVLKFKHEEYEKHLEYKENTWNLKDPTNDIENVIEMETGQDNEKSNKTYFTSTHNYSQTKFILQTLVSKLQVFAHYNNPRALYREKEFWHFYMHLLKGSNTFLQKAALDCILAYKSKALFPYKTILYNILDEKKFKEELINFKIESIALEHRSEVMPILLRILYGKMITKCTQKGMSPQQRKAVILRFLTQCSIEEIQDFLEMAFVLYQNYLQDSVDILKIPALVKESFDIRKVWSPKKLQSVLNLWDLIRKEFAGLMQAKFHYYMLKLLVFVGCVCNEVLSIDSSQLNNKMPLVFRNVKQNALQNLFNFFVHLEHFQWSDLLIKQLTEIYVYTSLDKLPQDSIHSPTILLKLLLHWGENVKYVRFLNQRAKDKENIFFYIIQLLMNNKTKTPVKKAIMGVIECILKSNENGLLEESEESLIKPFIPQILERIKLNFIERRSKQSLDKLDLHILAMLTKYVQDTENSEQLLQLLMPIMLNKTQSEASAEAIQQIITTLANLVKRVNKPELYLKKIAPYFEQIQDVSARKQLCDLVADIAKIKYKENPSSSESEHLKNVTRLLLLLNAWDKRWLEQPDYDKRLQAVREITEMINSGPGLELDLGILIIYNCFYFLRYDKDMGLRGNAAELLRLLVPHLTINCSKNTQELNYFLDEVFLKFIQAVIRMHSKENVREEGIRLLGEMVRKCSRFHIVFQDLFALTDANDLELDFFENLVHLQTHRHGRALQKFCQHASSLTKPPQVRTLTQFILPLATRYLLKESYASKHTLIDSAIEAVGVACHLLPWPQYLAILKYYLMKMRTAAEYQKQCVRIVVRILDAFHYDLSQGQVEDQAVLEKFKNELQDKSKNIEVGKAEKGNKADLEDNAEETANKEEENIEDDNQMLAEDLENDAEEYEQVEPTAVKNEPCLQCSLTLSAKASKRVLHVIITVLIPTLNRCITSQSSYDQKHKFNRKRLSMEREEEEILRVPISLAMVKLLQKLPQKLLEASLPGVFMKVCTFLRSPLKSVRMLTRDILKKIMLCLGPKYLATLIDHLQTLLTRGFQVHVLSVTVHGVLDALRESLQPKDVEKCLHNLLQVSLNDIFGEISLEKEIDKLVSHTPEAKPSAKSFLVLHIIARNIGESCLLDILLPFKDLLARSKSRKLVLKIQECISKIVNGLVENVNISRESLLIFIYGTISESITELLPGSQRLKLSEPEKKKMLLARPDCFIIPPAPVMRSGAINRSVKSNNQANAHILIEFGLEMLLIVLKRKKLVSIEYEPFLNPLLPLLRDSLKSSHIRVTTFALKCFASLWVEEYKLTTMETDEHYLRPVVERIFEILQNVSSFNASKQEDNLLLIKTCFKAIVALLRKCDYYQVTAEQIEQLVLHIEQELHDGEHQNLTFNLIKAMLTRKVESKAMHDIMKSIGELTITSHSEYVRDEARQLMITYVVEYPLNKKIDQIIKFYTAQLCYSLPAGRLSAIAFLESIIKKFPLFILNKKAELLYLSLGTRLVNDEDPECRRAVAQCLESFITRLEKAQRKRLFEMTLLFFEPTHKPSVREMAACLCSRFLNVEKGQFIERINIVLPLILARMTFNNPHAPGRFVKAPGPSQMDDKPKLRKRPKKLCKDIDGSEYEIETLLDNEEKQKEVAVLQQKALDHELIQMQYCVMKMFYYCSTEMLNKEDLCRLIDELAYESQRLLNHEHIWVRCNAAKTLTQILSTYDYSLIGRKLQNLSTNENISNACKLDFIYLNPEYDIKSLILDLCAQVIPGDTSQNMIDEIVKILLYVATMLKDVPFILKKEAKENNANDDDNGNVTTKINLNWLLRNIRYLINKELTKAPHSITVRLALFKLLEGLITLLTTESIEMLAPALLSSLVREMSEDDQNVDADLRQLALHVGSRLRKRIGSELYDKLRSEAQMKLMIRRAERKKILAQEKIHDPVRAAKRKANVQERKNDLKTSSHFWINENLFVAINKTWKSKCDMQETEPVVKQANGNSTSSNATTVQTNEYLENESSESNEPFLPRPEHYIAKPPPDMLPKYRELLLACQEHIEFFRSENTEKGLRLYAALLAWQDFIILANQLVQEIDAFAHNYDFDENTPGNGYRSFISVTHACVAHGLTLCGNLSSSRGTVFFRKKHYMKEVEACSQLQASLCNCLRHLLILHDWSKDTYDLFANGKHSAEELFEAGETINQYCFYGRCLGFQYSDSIKAILRIISISMAGFSETFYARDVDGPLVKTTRSVWTSGKYLINPEVKARRIVNLSQNAKIDFCKSFWFLAESEIMHKLPSVVAASVKINQLIEIPTEPLQLPCVGNSNKKPRSRKKQGKEIEWVDIPIPTAHLGAGKPITVRLLSSQRRDGMIGLGTKSFRHWRKMQPRSRAILFHCHGGGFVAQSSKSHEIYLRDWCVALETPILSVDYSLAPEAPFPRAIEEVFYAYCWMLKNAEHLGTTAERVVAMGDSAGANLSIALTLKCIEMNVRAPDGLFLAYCPTLISFVPSPARLLCLMDPLLPFGFMMRCLRAYAAPSQETKQENSKSEQLFHEICKANEQEPHYKLTLDVKSSKLTSPSKSPQSSVAENSKWEQIKVKGESGAEDAIELAEEEMEDSNDNTFASASYRSPTVENTDLPSFEDDTSLLSFEDDSQPIEHYPINKDRNSQSEKYVDEFLDSYIAQDSTEEAKEANELQTMTAKTLSEENLLTKTGKDAVRSKFQQALNNLSNTFNRITQSYDIKPDGVPFKEIEDLRNMDALIARSPSVEFAFQVPKDPFLSPYYACDEWLQKMPNTKILTIEMDPCLDDCVMFAKKLKRLNRPVTLDILKGLPHGFLNFTMLSNEAMEGSKHCIQSLKELMALSSLPPSSANSSTTSTDSREH